MTTLENIKAQLLDAYVQREAADEKIKALRNVLAGIQVVEQEAAASKKPEEAPAE